MALAPRASSRAPSSLPTVGRLAGMLRDEVRRRIAKLGLQQARCDASRAKRHYASYRSAGRAAPSRLRVSPNPVVGFAREQHLIALVHPPR